MISEILKCLYQCLWLPLAHFADDRIYAYKLYKQSLSIAAQMSERQRRDSILLRLQRASARQEVLNSIGIPKYREIQENKGNLMFSALWHARLVLFWFSLWWANECAVSFCEGNFPAGYEALMVLDGALRWVARSIVDMLPPYNS